jgi:hypothetical protein
MDSPSFKPLSPSKTPLFPTSPERINQQNLASSPSLPNDLAQFHQKQMDVQSKIAFLNGLSRTGSPITSPKHSTSTSSASAALQRAILGREEAESALSKAHAELSEGQSRERRISERLESLLEELQTTKERQAHERAVFEKEVRKARKEAFRASSTLVKFQEELKLSKGEVKNLKDEVRLERDAKEKAKQEAFERAYALAGITEELQGLKDQLRSFEAENRADALEAQAKEIQDKSVTEQRDKATPTHTPRRPKRSADAFELLHGSATYLESETHDEATPSKKIRLSRRISNKENQDPDVVEIQEDMIADLQEEVRWEQQQRQKAEDMVHFLKMECQFKRCSCRLAGNYVHDREWDNARQKDLMPIETENEHPSVSEDSPVTSAHSPLGSPASAMTPPTPHEREPEEQENIKFEKDIQHPQGLAMTFSPTTGTFHALPSPRNDRHGQVSEEPLVLPDADEPAVTSPVYKRSPTPPAKLEPQQTTDCEIPGHCEIKDEGQIECPSSTRLILSDNVSRRATPVETLPITPTDDAPDSTEELHVKTVPILTEDSQSRSAVAMIPGTPITREEALAQIRARRGRARSTAKRSASASEATVRARGIGVTPVRGTKRIPGATNSDTRSEPDVGNRRDISAPVGR